MIGFCLDIASATWLFYCFITGEAEIETEETEMLTPGMDNGELTFFFKLVVHWFQPAF
jgi:hypothetical protein